MAPLFIEPAGRCENGYAKSFNGKLRDELFSGELFYRLHEAQCSWNAGGRATSAGTSCTGVSATGPRNSQRDAHQCIGVTELKRCIAWPGRYPGLG
ncbi:integrase core domain-containing protein [Nitrospira sp. Nam74]